MSAREFTVAGEYVYDRRSPVRWIISHILRYPWLPAFTLLGNIGSSVLYNGGSILIGRAFDLVATPGVRAAELLALALLVLAARCGVGLVGLGTDLGGRRCWPSGWSATRARSCTSACWARARPSITASRSAT